MTRWILKAAFVSVTCWSAGAWADAATPSCVTPTASVVTSVAIRQSPSASGSAIGRLTPGQQLPISGEVPNWIQVTLSTDTSGYVSKRWTDVVDCASNAPIVSHPTGTSFELDAIDVGTGLSIFVRGPDFTMLYDAGSNDDLARGDNNRVVNYLKTVYPDVSHLDHLILSHPHRDHVELMADVVRQFSPHDVWDSGAAIGICGYRTFLQAVAATSGVTYHNANFNAGDENHALTQQTCYGQSEAAQTITLKHGARVDTTPINLGANARLTFLHVDGVTHANLNDNSLVARLDLGNHAVMLMGDSEAGGRANPSSTPTATSVEGKLLACCADQLHADLLVVGHHGSMSSSRKALLDAVGAKSFIVSAGPTKYGTVVLPDQVVIDELTSRGTVWRTDTNDAACRTSTTKIGKTNDGAPGGCSNVRVVIDDGGIDATVAP
jgi:beta-lactamase superfamily II metal-dependent hydrolase